LKKKTIYMTMPDYRLRYSKKAQYLQLRFSTQGLEVIVPAKRLVPPGAIAKFIQQKQTWINKNWQRWQASEQHPPAPLILPTTIHLPLLAQTWDVIYLATAQRRVTCTHNLSRQIKLLGNVADSARCVQGLCQWLKQMAEQHLRPQLLLIANETGLSFHQLTIRQTISRWGSCSGRKHISLCCNLLFLPPALVRHVLLHELCHTQQLHHGSAFWRLLEQYDPSMAVHKIQLKKASAYVPAWVNARGLLPIPF
jgi:predicted metal-dependent hydrolase